MSRYAIVRVTLLTPLALGKDGDSLPVLDSILLHRCCLMTSGDVDAGRRLLPLDRFTLGDAESAVWACGGAYFNRAVDGRLVEHRYVYQKFTDDRGLRELAYENMKGVKPGTWPNRLTNVMGRSYLAAGESRYSVVHATEVSFRMRGDPEAVVNLLSLEPYLGPGHSVGFGEIGDVSYEEHVGCDDAWLLVDDADRLTRPIPAELATSMGVKITAAWEDAVRVQAPYWMGPRVRGFRPVALTA